MTLSKRTRTALIAALVAFCVAGASNAGLEGLQEDVQILFDPFAVPTIVAANEHDAVFMLGYMHARDRYFQMDLQRKAFAGRASELVGPAGLPQDVQLRTLGLLRAAERSLPLQTPETMAWLEAYSDGVNAYILDPANIPPLEYFALERSQASFEPWTPLDCLLMAKGLAFGLSFDLGDIDNTLAILNMRGVGDALGFNGLHLHSTDTWRVAPFDPTISIPSQQVPAPPAPTAASSARPMGPLQAKAGETTPDYLDQPGFRTLLETYRQKIIDIKPLRDALETDFTKKGSNWWIAAGGLTDSGYPMIANDPHLALDAPATFYEAHLIVDGGINVAGASFPGTPGVVLGCNETVCWGATVNALDVTDVYNEVLIPLGPDPTVPTHTLFDGAPEAMQIIPQTFLVNGIGDGFPDTIVDAGIPATSGGVTFVVPRRNNGPIVNISFDPASPTPLTGLSVQYTGWSGTREIETLRRFASVASMQDFKDALQFFDVGSQNWAYADINGNIAYYTSAELPIREDLQFGGFPAGLNPPSLIRDGTHTNPHEWLVLLNPQPHQALGTEILPFDEMPQIENPAEGYVLNANNDPIGTTLNNLAWDQFRAFNPGFNGALYLSSSYAPGFRMGQLKQRWDAALAAGPVGVDTFKALQGDTHLLDAQVFMPFLQQAFDNASDPAAIPELQALAADPGVAEAIARFADWDFSTPTGIIEGFDIGDNPLAPMPPSADEIEKSISATIYALWRGQIVQRVIDGTLANLPVPLNGFAPGNAQAMSALRKLLEDFPTTGGTGASLLDFFVVPGIPDPFDRRDLILLGALRSGLDLLASDSFAPAFGNSTDQNDYRWGKLHRIVFDHPLGPPLSIPPNGFPGTIPGLAGFSTDGGMGALDASSHSVRADGVEEFRFGSGPSRRKIAVMAPTGPQVLEVLPGGESGQPGNPHGTDQLGLWLPNLYKPLPISKDDVLAFAVEEENYNPPFCGDSEIDAGEECDEGPDNGVGGTCDANCFEIPLLVVMESLTAEVTDAGVVLRWTTSTEIDTAGFRVYRATGNRTKAFTLLTPTAIPARGQELVGADYEFVDRRAPKGTLLYYVDDVDNFGRTTRHGPVMLQRGDPQGRTKN